MVSDWLERGIISDGDIMPVQPLTVDELCMAHDREYVESVLACKCQNGFGNFDQEVAASLTYTTGSMMSAALSVVGKRGEIACSPTSGFHHAGYDFGEGFCTFNGLMTTAIGLHKAGLVNKVLILDMDQHYGNGTDHIIERLGIDFVTHITAGKSYSNAHQALELCDLRRWVKPDEFDIVLYQAGVDSHIDDPLGGIFTTTQIRHRDWAVVTNIKKLGLPLVWNLAGGYRRDDSGGIEPVLALHRIMAEACPDFYDDGAMNEKGQWA